MEKPPVTDLTEGLHHCDVGFFICLINLNYFDLIQG